MKVYKCTFQYHQAGQLCDLGLHYQWDGDTGSDEPPASDLATRLDSHLRSAFKAMLPYTGASLDKLVVREEVPFGSGDVPDVAELLIGEVGTGASSSGTQAHEVVPLFHRKTGAAVRGAQSWAFGPSPYGSAGIVAGVWDTGSLTYIAWAAFCALLDDNIDHAGSIPGVSGTYHPIAYARTRQRRGITPFTFNITSSGVDARPRWLRSRAA